MRASPFIFPIGDLLRSDALPRRVAIEIPVHWGVELTKTAPDVPLRADLTLAHVSGGILVRGSVSVAVDNVCHRCLTQTREQLELEVAQMFVPEPGDDAHDANEADEYELDGDMIDLEPMLRDEVVLAMPMLPTCGDDCPRAGVDHLVSAGESGLNTGTPEDEGGPSSPFSVLQDLFDEGE
jgi:uncharacterized protein